MQTNTRVTREQVVTAAREHPTLNPRGVVTNKQRRSVSSMTRKGLSSEKKRLIAVISDAAAASSIFRERPPSDNGDVASSTKKCPSNIYMVFGRSTLTNNDKYFTFAGIKKSEPN
ncbi:hypothetical protein EVAR_15900_1 [Eumeta japonica]|uniref:Uncharacterized protein n=1 Tax=Eumeta variegata TaxID=151549 RepID=A0A4C1UFK2_EUMVA|nr:hypothetical protein EVAR_15900_1 [Eumeta japonica]